MPDLIVISDWPLLHLPNMQLRSDVVIILHPYLGKARTPLRNLPIDSDRPVLRSRHLRSEAIPIDVPCRHVQLDFSHYRKGAWGRY